MFSSGQRTLFGEVLSWVILAGVTVVGISHFEELTMLGRELTGAQTPPRDEVRMAQAVMGEDAAGVSGGYTVELPLRADGHYHADADVNGHSVQVLVDTGASIVALTAEDAEAVGIYVSSSDYTRKIQTANGSARAAPVVLDRVSIGDITVRDVRAVVLEAGTMPVSLLGMSFLNEVDRVAIRSGKLILQD
jgi:aspartyl protease family protein